MPMPPKLPKRPISAAQRRALDTANLWRRLDSQNVVRPDQPFVHVSNVSETLPLELQTVLRTSWQRLATADSRNNAVEEICQRTLVRGAPATTKTALSEISGVAIRGQCVASIILAEVLLQRDLDHASRTITSVECSDLERLQALDIDLCDETPMPVGRSDAEEASNKQPTASTADAV